MESTATADVFLESQRTLPVAQRCDVLVCGGGPAGVAAAIAAARAGAETHLLELHGCLGGVWTAGALSWILDPAEKPGLMREVVQELQRRASGTWRPGRKFAADPEVVKLLLEEMCLEAGVTPHLLTRVVAAARDSTNRLAVAVTKSKSGRLAWKAEVFVDATGDGDLAAQAGCGYDVGHPETGECQPHESHRRPHRPPLRRGATVHHPSRRKGAPSGADGARRRLALLRGADLDLYPGGQRRPAGRPGRPLPAHGQPRVRRLRHRRGPDHTGHAAGAGGGAPHGSRAALAWRRMARPGPGRHRGPDRRSGGPARPRALHRMHGRPPPRRPPRRRHLPASPFRWTCTPPTPSGARAWRRSTAPSSPNPTTSPCGPSSPATSTACSLPGAASAGTSSPTPATASPATP